MARSSERTREIPGKDRTGESDGSEAKSEETAPAPLQSTAIRLSNEPAIGVETHAENEDVPAITVLAPVDTATDTVEAQVPEQARSDRGAAPASGSGQSEVGASERRGRVETPSNHVTIDEAQANQTLGGTLPLVLNVEDRDPFAFDRYDLTDSVRARLDGLAAKLATAPYEKLRIIGFTDTIGTDEYNHKLSEKRAWSVAGYLMEKGVPPYKLVIEGHGKSARLTSTEECDGLRRDQLIVCLQKDRRVEISATVKEYNLRVR